MNAAAKYARVFAVGVQNTFVYRWNFFLRALFSLIPLAGTLCVWRAIYGGRGSDIAGYDLSSMIWYFLLVMIADAVISPTDDEWQIAADIRDGQINSFLTKPLNYLAYRFSLFLSGRLLQGLATVPTVLVVLVLLREHWHFPVHGITWWWTGCSMAMAAVLQFCIAYSLAMCAFWILEISTVVFILYSFEYFLSGHLFPLDIMPGWFLAVIDFLPFKYELFFPVSIFMERVSGMEMGRGLMIQAGWCVIMGLVARMMWTLGIRKYQAVGG